MTPPLATATFTLAARDNVTTTTYTPEKASLDAFQQLVDRVAPFFRHYLIRANGGVLIKGIPEKFTELSIWRIILACDELSDSEVALENALAELNAMTDSPAVSLAQQRLAQLTVDTARIRLKDKNKAIGEISKSTGLQVHFLNPAPPRKNAAARFLQPINTFSY